MAFDVSLTEEQRRAAIRFLIELQRDDPSRTDLAHRAELAACSMLNGATGPLNEGGRVDYCQELGESLLVLIDWEPWETICANVVRYVNEGKRPERWTKEVQCSTK